MVISLFDLFVDGTFALVDHFKEQVSLKLSVSNNLLGLKILIEKDYYKFFDNSY